MKRSAKLTGKGGVRAAVVAKKKKVSESGDKDTADEVWDEDEKQIHEEEVAAKKAAEALHESNSGDDATKKAQDTTVVKVKRERTESTSEHDTSTKSTESKKRVALNLTCVHCKSECQTALVSTFTRFPQYFILMLFHSRNTKPTWMENCIVLLSGRPKLSNKASFNACVSVNGMPKRKLTKVSTRIHVQNIAKHVAYFTNKQERSIKRPKTT